MSKIKATIKNPDGSTSDVEVSIEMWGPAEAKDALDAMPEFQRNKKFHSIARICDSINFEQFYFNGDTFVFDEYGQFVNGQHRAICIVKTGATLPVLVVRGVSENAYITIDADGVGKQPADYFRYENVPNAIVAAAAASYVWRYDHRTEGGWLRNGSTATRTSLFQVYLNHAESIQRGNRQLHAIYKFIGSKGAVVACGVLIERAYGVAFAERFFSELFSGITDCKAVELLRAKIAADNNKPRRALGADQRFCSILEAARIMQSGSKKGRISSAIQRAPDL